MTTDLDGYAEALNDIALASGVDPEAVNFRDAVPAGTPLGETRGNFGETYRWRKAESGQRMGGKTLPDRVPLWHRITGDKSMVPPTIAMKRMTDPRYAGMFTTREPENIPQRIPIDKSCPICDAARLANPQIPADQKKRVFYDLATLERHMARMHGDEWETMLRQERLEMEQANADRQAEQTDVMVKLLNAVIGRMDGEDVDLPPEIEERLEGQLPRRGRPRKVVGAE